MKLMSGYQDTRNNNEDFAITPYLFAVFFEGRNTKVYGIGLCWFFHAIYIGVGFNVPKGYGGFKNIS